MGEGVEDEEETGGAAMHPVRRHRAAVKIGRNRFIAVTSRLLPPVREKAGADSRLSCGCMGLSVGKQRLCLLHRITSVRAGLLTGIESALFYLHYTISPV